MELKEIGEFGFIERVSKDLKKYGSSLIKGVGDDCSVFRINDNTFGLITTDLLVENVHFLIDTISPEDLGYKSLAVNLSDIAAMGGIPGDAYISIAIPEKISVEFLDDFYSGIKELADKYEVNLAGGDTTHSKRDFLISFTVYGVCEKPVFRSGAKTGDKIYSTGYLGDSAAGLMSLLNNFELPNNVKDFLTKAHNHPEPMVGEGRFLNENFNISSMIDVSDGLVSDLGHICKQSSVGAFIYEDKIPLSQEFKIFLEKTGSRNFDLALTGGEDYHLLFTIPSKDAQTVEKAFVNRFGKPIYHIGDIMDESGIFIVSGGGEKRGLTKSGYDHFKENKK